MPAMRKKNFTPARRFLQGILLAAIFPLFIAAQPDQTPVYTFKVIQRYPHDGNAFTQGLVYHDGYLYEGTGRRGQSTLRKVDIKTGTVLQLHELAPRYFGEGVCIFGDRIIQLTWESQTGFVYDLSTFTQLEEFYYPNQGWGITSDGQQLICSDGTANLYFWDPGTFAEIGRVEVRDHRGPVDRLNELEYINGEVYANIFGSDLIARIDPKTGMVKSYLDLSGLLPGRGRGGEDVLNGIAYDAERKRLFVTGKLWPALFEIEVIGPNE